MKLLTLFHFRGIQPDINSGQHSMDPFSHFCFFMQYSLGSKNTLWKLKIAGYIVLINKTKTKLKHTPHVLVCILKVPEFYSIALDSEKVLSKLPAVAVTCGLGGAW